MIKYRGDAVNIVSYNKPSNSVEIVRVAGGCWSWGCCISPLTRDISCLTDDSEKMVNRRKLILQNSKKVG